jgi:hypothetical protein
MIPTRIDQFVVPLLYGRKGPNERGYGFTLGSRTIELAGIDMGLCKARFHRSWRLWNLQIAFLA